MNSEKYIDISYPLDERIAIYPGNPTFCFKRVQDINRGDLANVSSIVMGSHTGTHIDVPAHIIGGGETIDQVPLERMNGVAKVIDATEIVDIDVEFLKYISIDREDMLLFKTDNSFDWCCDRILDEYVTLTYDAAEYLAKKSIKLIGIDYLTVEIPRSRRERGKSVHKSLLGNDILICEALKLKDILPGEYEFLCLPLNIVGLDGCPVRCVLRNL